MPSHGLKSDTKHPYMKRVNPFWRHTEPGSLVTYSEETKDNFERFKFDFEQSCKYYQWEARPKAE